MNETVGGKFMLSKYDRNSNNVSVVLYVFYSNGPIDGSSEKSIFLTTFNCYLTLHKEQMNTDKQALIIPSL
jgi:hypothetical protein